MTRTILGKVTMGTKEYRSIMDEIANLKVQVNTYRGEEFEQYKRAEKADARVEYLMRFIQSDADINNKFREYEVKNAEAKN